MSAINWPDTITYVVGATGVAFWLWMAFGPSGDDHE